MANHVNTYVNFERINDAGKAVLEQLYSRIRPRDDKYERNHYEWFPDIWGLDTDITDKYDWTIDNIGPKWCYFEDRQETEFHLVSAWSPPIQGLQWLFDRIGEVDNNFIASVQYDDEGLNFYGAQVYTSEGVSNEFEDDYDELLNDLTDSVEELKQLKENHTDEEEEWTDSDEFHDIFNDNAWTYTSDRQYEFIRETVEWIKEEEENA